MRPPADEYMVKATRAEVHFHEDDTAACLVETTSIGEEAITDELLLWACFANRQLNNMGPDASTLASLLANMWEGLSDLVDHDGTGPRLLDEPGSKSRKRFEARLMPHGEGLRFYLSMKGFGILGKRLPYYCPASVVLLLRYLARQRRDVPDYVACLGHIAGATGEAYLMGKVNMRNANERACMHVLGVLSLYDYDAESDGAPDKEQTRSES